VPSGGESRARRVGDAGRLVVYESRLELARIMLADFDPSVAGIAAQPLLLTGAGARDLAPCPGSAAGWRGRRDHGDRCEGAVPDG